MANRPTPPPATRVGDDPTTRRLRELAAQEAAATKERLATRTAAARLFSGAVARLAETKAAWERAQAEAQRAQAEAVKDLLGSGMQARRWPNCSASRRGSCRACVLKGPSAQRRRMAK